MHGLTVYPTISWSTPESYEWCFDGEPVGGIVAVSSVGVYNDDDARKLFISGYNEMMKRLNPSWVIWYGRVFEPCDWNVIRIPAHDEQIHKRARAAEERRIPWEQLKVF